MYSLILMTALSAAPDQQDFNGFFRRLFSFGGSDCYGNCRSSNGCYGTDRYGCYGNRVRAFDPDSCNCYGSAASTRNSSGCYGSAYSCLGGSAPQMPGQDFAVPSPARSFSSSGGCLGAGASSFALGSPVPVGEPFVIGGPPRVDLIAEPSPTNSSPDNSNNLNTRRFASSDQLASSTNRAKVTIRLPADARLYADGRPLLLTSGTREFVTPILPTNLEYQYTFRAEYERDGEMIAQSKRLSIKAGGTFDLEFQDLTLAKANSKSVPDKLARPDPLPFAALPSVEMPSLTPTVPGPKTVSLPSGEPQGKPLPRPAIPTSSSAQRARITVKLAPGAKLYVDGQPNERAELFREFTTPPLPPGQEFAYLMRSEVIRNGQPESQQTKVTFRAGELVTVDFTASPMKR